MTHSAQLARPVIRRRRRRSAADALGIVACVLDPPDGSRFKARDVMMISRADMDATNIRRGFQSLRERRRGCSRTGTQSSAHAAATASVDAYCVYLVSERVSE